MSTVYISEYVDIEVEEFFRECDKKEKEKLRELLKDEPVGLDGLVDALHKVCAPGNALLLQRAIAALHPRERETLVEELSK